MRAALHHHAKPVAASAPARAASVAPSPAPQPTRPAPMHDISGVSIEGVAQRKAASGANAQAYRAPNRTGLPDHLKAGIETLSGLSMDRVRVHFGSSEPAQLHAHAFTRGSDIHVAPGQERHLPHEAWHAVQQARGDVTPTARLANVPINDDAGLEHNADVMGARAARTGEQVVRSAASPLPSPRQSAAPRAVQRAVILGREKTSWYHLGSGSTMKRLLTMKDYNEVLRLVIKYLLSLPDEADAEDALSTTNVAAWKGLRGHALENYDQIAATLKRWIEAHGTARASTTGTDERAEWKEFETIEELALALAHETHPNYQKNLAQEGQLAERINNDEWVEQQLASVIAKVRLFQANNVSTFRKVAEPIESTIFGSYNLAKTVTSVFSPFKKVDKRGPSQAISATKASITRSITFLHDLMERWSSSGAGSTAAKIHEWVGVDKVLPDAPDKAFESTTLDEERAAFSADRTPIIGTSRTTKKISQDEQDEIVFDIAMKRAIRAAEKSREDMAAITNLREAMKTATTAEKKENLNLKIAVLEQRIENRKARIASEGFGQLSFNDNLTPQTTVSGRAEQAKKLPDYGAFAAMLKKKQKERADDKLKRAKTGAIDKSSKAKGRRNVGTRLENNPDTLLARMMSAPVTAGRSMTTARMMQLVEMVGGTNAEKTAVAYALFAYWARTYNQGLTPVHTFHETLDVAQNFGVPYKAFHYPWVSGGKLDLMNPGQYEPMSDNAAQSGRWTEFRRLLDQVPRVARPLPVRPAENRQAEESKTNSDQRSDESGEIDEEIEAPRIPADEFVLRPNAGGGDCLFYALEGHNLTARQLLDLRRQIADERRRMPTNRDNINAMNVAAALRQTPQTNASWRGLMARRDNVSNAVYAAMQEVPGIYAGEDELVQYCRLRGISVAVISWDGMLQIADATGIRRVNYVSGEKEEAMRRILAQTNIAVYKSPGHWERIDGARKPEFDDALALVPNAPEHSILRMTQDVRNAFGILGLRLGQFDDVNRAFRQIALRFHPDKVGVQGADRFKQAAAAKETLTRIAENPKEKDKVLKLALTEN